jgi:hypothetical protein
MTFLESVQSVITKYRTFSETQAESVVQPHGVADDIGREPEAAVARSGMIHRSSLPANA